MTNANEMTFDMRFHAFVIAVPLRELPAGRGMALGEPVIAMNQGDTATVAQALRAIADCIDEDGTEEVGRFPLQ